MKASGCSPPVLSRAAWSCSRLKPERQSRSRPPRLPRLAEVSWSGEHRRRGKGRERRGKGEGRERRAKGEVRSGSDEPPGACARFHPRRGEPAGRARECRMDYDTTTIAAT